MQLTSHVKLGVYRDLEAVVLDLIGKGYTKVAHRDECRARQYYLGPGLGAPDRYVLLWQSDEEQ